MYSKYKIAILLITIIIIVDFANSKVIGPVHYHGDIPLNEPKKRVQAAKIPQKPLPHTKSHNNSTQKLTKIPILKKLTHYAKALHKPIKITKKELITEDKKHCSTVELICVRACKLKYYAARSFNNNTQKFSYKISDIQTDGDIVNGTFFDFKGYSKKNMDCQRECYVKNSCWSQMKNKNQSIFNLCSKMNETCRRDYCPKHANENHLKCVVDCSGTICEKLTLQAVLIRNKFYMFRKNYNQIRTGRGLVTTVNHNIPDKLDDVPLHRQDLEFLQKNGIRRVPNRFSDKKTEKKLKNPITSKNKESKSPLNNDGEVKHHNEGPDMLTRFGKKNDKENSDQENYKLF